MPRLIHLAPQSTAATAPAVANIDGKPKSPPQPAERFTLRVAASAIDGLGVFAAEAIAARRKIGELRGESISVREARQRAKGRARIHIVTVSETRAVDATDSPDLLRWVNHGCSPNALLRINQGRVEFYALRNIAVGEEISCDYGESHHQGRLTCRCGSAHCAGKL
jgi:SET domain-containing protein